MSLLCVFNHSDTEMLDTIQSLELLFLLLLLAKVHRPYPLLPRKS